jgi:hypothetical protein
MNKGTDKARDVETDTIAMDLHEACAILGFEKWMDVNRESLKRKYYILALKHHPDKGGDEEVFKKIKNAHETLEQMLEYKSSFASQYEGTWTDSDDSINTASYQTFLNQVIHQWLKGQCPTPLMNEILQGIHKMSLSLFEKMDARSVQLLYHFLANFCEYEKHFPDFMNQLRQFLERDKSGNEVSTVGSSRSETKTFVVHPTLDDLFENNVYSWEYEGHKYFVPLWHHDLVFDDKNCGDDGGNMNHKELHVSCVPDLPENVFIDEKNHIYVHVNIPFDRTMLLDKEDVDVWLGKRCFKIPMKSLVVKKEQWYVMKKKGISMIYDNKNIYAITEKSNLYFHIVFV